MADILKRGRGVQEKDVRGRHPPTHPMTIDCLPVLHCSKGMARHESEVS